MRAEVFNANEVAFIAPPIQSYRVFPCVLTDGFYRSKFIHRFSRALFFARAEGVFAGLRKYRSNRLELLLNSEEAIVVAKFADGDRHFLGFTHALRDCPVFERHLIFMCSAKNGPADVVLNDEGLALLEGYLPVPSCPVPKRLVQEIVRLNPFLMELRDVSMLDRHAIPRAATADNQSVGVTNPKPASQTVYVLGLGSYAREQVLPAFHGQVGAALDYRARRLAKYLSPGFPIYESLDDILPAIARDSHPLVIICTYHSDHAPMALAVLDCNPTAQVFIEKPPAVELGELAELVRRAQHGAWIDVGYNRRYAALTRVLKAKLSTFPGPYVISIVVKELKIPRSHWYWWENQGGRITGNVCHWIDLMTYLVGANPTKLSAMSSRDQISMSMVFTDQSVGTITATDFGDDLRGVEETLDVRSLNTTISLLDYRELIVRHDGGTERIGRRRRDKGHATMYSELRKRVERGLPPAYPARDLYAVGYVVHTAADMVRKGEAVRDLGTDFATSLPSE